MSDAPRFAHVRFRQATEVLERALAFEHPVDQLLERFFKAHREMGGKDRGSCAEAVYGVLRNLRLLEYFVARAAVPRTPQTLAGAWYLAEGGWSARALADADCGFDAEPLVKVVRGTERATLAFAVRWSFPEWLATRIEAQYGSDAEPLARALAQQAPIDLRANSFKCTRDELIARFAAAGIAAAPIADAPDGLRLAKRAALFNTAEFRAGLFEMQDAGSQRVSALLAPQPGERILDLCAGAGGKTLHLAALLANTGQVYACDVNEKRLAKLHPRLARAGLSNVQARALSGLADPWLAAQRGVFDAVLVDAPCSGTGTLRRNPDIKWRHVDLVELGATQRALLDAALYCTKPGGRVVYATCSLLREENEDVVAACGFAAQRTLTLLPHRDGCDGFFAARIELPRA